MIDPRSPPRHQGVECTLLWTGILTGSQLTKQLLADTSGLASDTAGCWVSTSPSGYVTVFGKAGVPPPGLEGGVGCNPRVTFDGKVQNLGLRTICFCPQIPPLPEDHQANILSIADRLRHHCKLGGGSVSIPSTSLYRGSKWDRRVVRRPRRAKSDCPTTGDRLLLFITAVPDRQGSSPHSRQA